MLLGANALTGPTRHHPRSPAVTVELRLKPLQSLGSMRVRIPPRALLTRDFVVFGVSGRAGLLTELLTVVVHPTCGDAPQPRVNALVAATRRCSGTRAGTVDVRPKTLCSLRRCVGRLPPGPAIPLSRTFAWRVDLNRIRRDDCSQKTPAPRGLWFGDPTDTCRPMWASTGKGTRRARQPIDSPSAPTPRGTESTVGSSVESKRPCVRPALRLGQAKGRSTLAAAMVGEDAMASRGAIGHRPRLDVPASGRSSFPRAVACVGAETRCVSCAMAQGRGDGEPVHWVGHVFLPGVDQGKPLGVDLSVDAAYGDGSPWLGIDPSGSVGRYLGSGEDLPGLRVGRHHRHAQADSVATVGPARLIGGEPQSPSYGRGSTGRSLDIGTTSARPARRTNSRISARA
jgi:hypothetical protein